MDRGCLCADPALHLRAAWSRAVAQFSPMALRPISDVMSNVFFPPTALRCSRPKEPDCGLRICSHRGEPWAEMLRGRQPLPSINNFYGQTECNIVPQLKQPVSTPPGMYRQPVPAYSGVDVDEIRQKTKATSAIRKGSASICWLLRARMKRAEISRRLMRRRRRRNSIDSALCRARYVITQAATASSAKIEIVC